MIAPENFALYNPIKNDLNLNIICDGNGNQYCQNAENDVCPTSDRN